MFKTEWVLKGLLVLFSFCFLERNKKKEKFRKKKLRHWFRSKNKEVPGVKEKPSQAREMKGRSLWLTDGGLCGQERGCQGLPKGPIMGLRGKSIWLGSNPAAGVHWVGPS